MKQDHLKARAWQDDHYVYPDNRRNHVESMADFYKRLYIDTTLEACTGLKDKNGKLIYEGDILISKIDTSKEPFVIEFCQDAAYFGAYPEFDMAAIMSDNYLEYEVGGNLHENKELLEK